MAERNALGAEEKELCEVCMNESRPIVIATQVFAGHFAFGSQKETMKKFFNENRNSFV